MGQGRYKIGWQYCLGIDLIIPDDFGHWLAGFADGEATFGIQIHKKQRNVVCRWVLQLREDDAEILYEIQRVLGGIGVISRISRARSRAGGVNARDQVAYSVQAIGDIIHVVIPLFEKYSLRAKKKRDFVIWAQAARLVQARAHHTKHGLAVIRELKRELSAGRGGYRG